MNNGADQPALQRSLISTIFICLLVSMIYCLATCEISILQIVSVAEQVGLCPTWSKIPKTHFLPSRPNGIQNSDQQFRSKFSLKDLSIYNSGCHFVQRSRTFYLWRLRKLGNFASFFCHLISSYHNRIFD